MGIREDRLQTELTCMEELCRQSSFITFCTRNEPPDEYFVTFTCTGLVAPEKRGNQHVSRIYLPVGYPRDPPQVSFLTPCFHPNIAALIQMGSVQERIQDALDRAPDEAARQQIEQQILSNEELFLAQVCLDTLEVNWSPTLTLDLICLELAEMIQYKRYNPASPLNEEAAFWAVRNENRLPIDNRSILDLKALANIRILSEVAVEPDDIDIQIL